MKQYHCHSCGWTGPEEETRSNASCKHGCPVCWDRRGKYIPVGKAVAEKQEPQTEPMPDFSGWV